jgi:hypothetical protein
MPATALAEERGRRTLTFLAEQYGLQRGNWEVDYPDYADPCVMPTSDQGPLCEW